MKATQGVKEKIMLDIRDINLVGTVHSPKGIAAANKNRQKIDIAEFRADILPNSAKSPALARLKTPILWTVRCASEGGKGSLSILQREKLYHAGLGIASLVDVELASVRKLKSTMEVFKVAGHRLVLSYHDFKSTPQSAALKRIIRSGRDAGADIVKIAVTVNTLAELSRLMSVFEFAGKTPVAVMGMGKFGKASRVLCAQAGSVLNYGWLDRPQVPGQWSAVDMAWVFSKLEIKKTGRH